MSSAPLIRIARIKSERGSLMPSVSLRYCLTIAAAPATTGVAIDEPLSVMYNGVLPSLCVVLEHEPPLANCASSALAEQIITPGATRSGFMRPSRVVPLDENPVTVPSAVLPYAPVVEAPTVRTFLAVPGGVTLLAPLEPRSPAEKSTRKRGKSTRNESADLESELYSPTRFSLPQLLVCMRALFCHE